MPPIFYKKVDLPGFFFQKIIMNQPQKTFNFWTDCTCCTAFLIVNLIDSFFCIFLLFQSLIKIKIEIESCLHYIDIIAYYHIQKENEYFSQIKISCAMSIEHVHCAVPLKI